MDHFYISIVVRLVLALLAGAAIGLERTYHGRPAGFRTHSLVCVASALLMQFTVNQWELLDPQALATVRVDPTRMAQGIMTGIGFLGAGVILKEGLTIRGLTTAASIWITASIGIILGIGMYFPGLVATLMAGGILSMFRWIEDRTPRLRYGRLVVRFKRAEHLSETELRDIVHGHGIEWTNPCYRVEGEGRVFCYEMTVRTLKPANFESLAESLNSMERVLEFSILPTGD